MVKIKCAMIGYGYWGKTITKKIESNEILDLIYIYSPNYKQHEKYTESYELIFNDGGIDCIFIATPSSTHFKWIQLALKAKKHVFCEKPLVTNPLDYVEIINLLKKSNRVLYTDYTYVFSSKTKNAVDFIKKNKSNLTLNFKFEQNGPYYSEHIYWTLLPHVLSILNIIADIDDISIDFLNLKYNDGYIKYLEFKYNLNNIDGTLVVSLISKCKRRTIELKNHCDRNIINFDLLDFNLSEEFLSESKPLIKDNLTLSIDSFIDLITNYKTRKIELSSNLKLAYSILKVIAKIERKISSGEFISK